MLCSNKKQVTRKMWFNNLILQNYTTVKVSNQVIVYT